MLSRACTLAAASLLLLCAIPALASDGVLEINQTCATQTGCFPGDTRGFPVTITGAEGRSYRLTSDLLLPDRDTTAITITRRDTSIDLNGFEIILTACQALNCLPLSGLGIGVLAEDVLGVSVKNGTISATGSDGIRLGDQAKVTDVRVRWNGGDGIDVGDGASVSDCMAFRNGGRGIRTENGSTVSGNTTHENGAEGIRAEFGSTVSGNTVFENDGDGIRAGVGSTVSGNTAFRNGNGGISCANGCTVVGNAAYQNGIGPGTAIDDGIECGAGCVVRGNSMRSNTGFGLTLGSSAYMENVITDNQAGTVLGSGRDNSLGGNFCAGTGTASPTCP